jgi:hypothetical protein
MSIDPLWPKERPYDYSQGNPANQADSSGLFAQHPLEGWVIHLGKHRDIPLIDAACNRTRGMVGGRQVSVQNIVIDWCDMISTGALDAHIGTINDCVSRATSAANLSCQIFNSNRLACMKDFCRTGRVDCLKTMGSPPNDDEVGHTPGFQQGNDPRHHGNIQINVFDDAMNTYDPDTADYQGVFLHELMHACGVAHSKNLESNVYRGSFVNDSKGHKLDTTFECNNIFACCIQRTMIAPSRISECWTRMATNYTDYISLHYPPGPTLGPMSRPSCA